MKHCEDLKEYGLTFDCCDICHEDLKEYNFDLFYRNFLDNEYYICCSALGALETYLGLGKEE